MKRMLEFFTSDDRSRLIAPGNVDNTIELAILILKRMQIESCPIIQICGKEEGTLRDSGFKRVDDALKDKQYSMFDQYPFYERIGQTCEHGRFGEKYEEKIKRFCAVIFETKIISQLIFLPNYEVIPEAVAERIVALEFQIEIVENIPAWAN